MTERRRERSACGRPGFALVVVMLIGAMASVAAATVFTVAMASAKVAGADRRSELARAAADTGLVDAVDRLTWGLAGQSGAQVRESWTAGLGGEESYNVVLAQRLPAAGWPRTYDVEVAGEHGAAGAALQAVVRLSPTRLPYGVSVAGAVTCAAQTTVRGCGLYAGSDVRGREKVTFEAAGNDAAPVDDPPADFAHGELWPVAAVHAGGHIYRGGSEEHAQAGAPEADTDSCTGAALPQSIVRLPSAGIVADCAARAPVLQTSYPGGSLDLSTLPGPAGGGGLVVVARAASQPLSITGLRPAPPLAPQLTLLVLGDARVVAAPIPSPEGVGMSGALIVTGTLTVQTPTSILGSLAAGALQVDAPLLVDLPSGWRDQPPPGALSAQVLARW